MKSKQSLKKKATFAMAKPENQARRSTRKRLPYVPNA
jgi:hypothetical protein